MKKKLTKKQLARIAKLKEKTKAEAMRAAIESEAARRRQEEYERQIVLKHLIAVVEANGYTVTKNTKL